MKKKRLSFTNKHLYWTLDKLEKSFIEKKSDENYSSAVCNEEEAPSKTKMPKIQCDVHRHYSKTPLESDDLWGHEQTWDCSVVFSCFRLHNEWPELCSTASGKAEYTHGGA